MLNLVLKIQENDFYLKIYRFLGKIIKIIPYYIMIESLASAKGKKFSPKIDGLQILYLNETDMEFLGNHTEVIENTKELKNYLDRGCLCLGLKHGNEIAAYTWCNLKEFDYKKRRVKLTSDEAYLFDARTFLKYRGANLAPYLRYKLYEELKAIGKINFLSVTLYSNTASMRFKEKLGSYPKEFYIYFRIFDKFNFHYKIKNL